MPESFMSKIMDCYRLNKGLPEAEIEKKCSKLYVDAVMYYYAMVDCGLELFPDCLEQNPDLIFKIAALKLLYESLMKSAYSNAVDIKEAVKKLTSDLKEVKRETLNIEIDKEELKKQFMEMQEDSGF